MSLRAALLRSQIAPRRSAVQAVRAFSRPSQVLRKEDEKELPPGYEKHMVEVETPSAGTTDGSIRIEYPKSWDPKDIGHQTVGPGHGRHQKRTLSSFSMEDKVCVITGAARGLGNMFARTFVESGATKVAILDLKQGEADQACKDMVEWAESHGEAENGAVEAKGWACDVSSEESVAQVFADIEKTFGRIDVLVTAAGIVENFSAIDYPTPKIKKLIDINIMGTYFCAREAAKRMQKGSSVVMIGSMSGSVVNVPQPQTPYNFSKAAVRHMASSMAVEWAPLGIRVNCISPGYVLTNLTKTILDANTELRDTWVNMTPMGRLANPDDLKGAVVYLASDASAFTTGSDMRIDGGYTCT